MKGDTAPMIGDQTGPVSRLANYQITDSADQSVTLTYADDPNAIVTDTWSPWVIELAALNIDLTNIKSLEVGVGDLANSQVGLNGVILIDEVWLR